MPPVRKVKPAKASIAPVVPSAAAPVVEKKAVISGQLDKKIKKKQQQQQKKAVEERGVVFIKHLPHGFFEEQLKKYFQQFGDVTRLRLARSKRTGGSKSFAFVEFEHPEVAQVAAETMSNYLMFKKVVKASYIPPEQQRFNYFKTSLQKVKNKAGKEIYVSSKTAATQRRVKQHNDWSEDNYQKRTQGKINKITKLNEKYAHLGIDFSSILVQPKKLSADEKAQKVAADGAKKLGKNVDGSKSNSAIKRKPTTLPATKQTVNASQRSNAKKIKKDVALEDLLGNTINDDSEDEDYIAMPESSDEDDAEATSDEETYGFKKDSDSDDDEGEDQDDEIQVKSSSNKSKSSFSKSVKPSTADRFENLIKRKPHVGGVQKFNKKGPKEPPAKKNTKNLMQLAAAKEVAKPLSSLKKTIKQKTKQGKKQKV